MNKASEPMDNLVAYPVNHDIVIINAKGICIASSSEERVGEAITIPSNPPSIQEIVVINNFTGNFYLRYDKNDYNKKEIELLKKLAKITFEQYINSINQPKKTIDQFIANLIQAPFLPRNLSREEQEADSLGLDLTLDRVSILIEIDDFVMNHLKDVNPNYDQSDIIEDWKGKITRSLNSFFTKPSDMIIAYLGNGKFIIFKEMNSPFENFKKNIQIAFLEIFGSLMHANQENSLFVGFSNPYSGLKGLYFAHHEAQEAVIFGKKITHKKNQIYYYGDLGTIRILTEKDHQKKKTFAQEVLAPLEKETLRLTLETFLNENMDVKLTAKKLKVHPNTVNYRLGKIAELLGLDPRVFKQAFELRIALLTDQIFT